MSHSWHGAGGAVSGGAGLMNGTTMGSAGISNIGCLRSGDDVDVAAASIPTRQARLLLYCGWLLGPWCGSWVGTVKAGG